MAPGHISALCHAFSDIPDLEIGTKTVAMWKLLSSLYLRGAACWKEQTVGIKNSPEILPFLIPPTGSRQAASYQPSTPFIVLVHKHRINL